MSLTAIDKNQQTGFGAHFVDGELHTRADEQATAPADVEGWVGVSADHHGDPSGRIRHVSRKTAARQNDRRRRRARAPYGSRCGSENGSVSGPAVRARDGAVAIHEVTGSTPVWSTKSSLSVLIPRK
jgi:hypothetical protein